jgi:hypothetical protein
MKKIFSILIAISLTTTYMCCAQQTNPSTNAVNQEAIDSTIDNQQINQDEGYGSDDEEYYDAEGNTDDSKVVNKDKT